MPSVFRFSDLELDLRRYELRRNGQVVKLERIPMELLGFLVQERDRLVTREEIIQRIWGKGVFVDTDNAINTAVRKIRQALKDDPAKPQFLERVPGKGYRFIGEVTVFDRATAVVGNGGTTATSAAPALASSSQTALRSRSMQWWRLWLGLAGASLLLLVSWLWFARRGPSASSTHAISSLAVLPLENLSGDASQDYLSEGLTDELITDLAKLPNLRVISRTSTVRYKKTDKSLPQIARELNVDGVVEGTMLWSNNRVRIRVQLIDARTDRHLWAEAYERQMNDVLSLQNDVARAITHQINFELTPQQSARISKSQPPNFEAYSSYLKGRYEWNKRTPESLNQSIRYFEEAIARDPSYALAHEGLAETYTVLATYGAVPPQQAYAKANAEASKALELDASLGEAHASLAVIRHGERDWQGSEQEYLRALELSPGYATAHQWYAEYLLETGRFDQGLAEMRRALELDPGSPLMNGLLGMGFYEARQYDKAVQQLQKAIEMEPGFPYAHAWLGFAYEQQAMRQNAVQEFQKAFGLSRGNPIFEAFLGFSRGLSGERDQAQNIAEKLVALSNSKKVFISPVCIALVYTSLGEKDRAFDWLEKSLAGPDFFVAWIKVEPALEPLRSEPRFQDLLRRIGMPQ